MALGLENVLCELLLTTPILPAYRDSRKSLIHLDNSAPRDDPLAGHACVTPPEAPALKVFCFLSFFGSRRPVSQEHTGTPSKINSHEASMKNREA